MQTTLLFALMFISAASMQLYAVQPCSLKTVKIPGQQLGGGVHTKDYLADVFDPVPCVWTQKKGQHADYGTNSPIYVDSAPQLADIVIDGKIIGKTPAFLILERTITNKQFTVVFKKIGFKDAVGVVTASRGGKIRLVPEDASKVLPPEDLSKGDDLPPIVQTRCRAKAWINAFDLSKPVNSENYLCPADRSRALFTREGTLACQDAQTLHALINGNGYGWFTRPTPEEAAKALAGDSSLWNAGQIKYLNSKQCTVYHDGAAVKIHEEDRGMASTNIGWVPEANLRNR